MQVKIGINGALARTLCMSRPQPEKRRFSLCRYRLGDIQTNDRTTHSLLPNLLESEEEYRTLQENNGMSGLSRSSPYNSDWIRPPPKSPRHARLSQIDDTSVSEQYGILSQEVNRVLLEIRKITSKLKQDEEDNELKNEWKFAALVIDRLCLWVCLGTTLISTLAILCSAPHLIA